MVSRANLHRHFLGGFGRLIGLVTHIERAISFHGAGGGFRGFAGLVVRIGAAVGIHLRAAR